MVEISKLHTMSKTKNLPNEREVLRELGKIKTVDDFFGKEGAFSKLFSKTIETMLEAELEEHLGYSKHSVSGNNSGNSRNGSYPKKLKTSYGEQVVEIPRDRDSSFEPLVLPKGGGATTNEIEDKIINLYANGQTNSEITDFLHETYGIGLSNQQISIITDKVLPLVEEWRTRPIESHYAIIYLDCIFVRVRYEGSIKKRPCYIAMGINLATGKKEILGHYLSTEDGEGSSFWLTTIQDLHARGLQDVFIACVDGLKGFKEAIHAIYPECIVQRCMVHQIRYMTKFVPWNQRKEFILDLKTIYKANTLKEAELNFKKFKEKYNKKYSISVKSLENNWDDLTHYFGFTAPIRKLMYTTNPIESYNRQIRKYIKKKGSFPTIQSFYKMLYLCNQKIEKKWDANKVRDWPTILAQLSIKFENRMPVLKEV